MQKTINDWQFVIIMCLTLGLAPFVPEPHIFGKVRWVMGGGVGMEMMDWLDFLFHGLPWFLLIRLVILRVYKAANLKVKEEKPLMSNRKKE